MQLSKPGRLLPLAILLALALPLCGIAAAAEEGGEFGFLVGAAFGDKNLVGQDKDTDPNPLVGIRYGNLFADHWGFFADGIWIPYSGEGFVGDSTEVAARFGVELLTSPEHNTRWFLAGGLGGAQFTPDAGDSFTRALASLGLGFRHPFADTGSFRMEVRGEQTVSDDGLNNADILNYQVLLGLAWGVGGPPKDTDADGVIDRHDDCPDTPAGATVDAKGCPKDSDGDRVWDGLDRCPDTPKGTPVDASGCPLDSDGDGVHDGIDVCPNTPSGVKVDAKGCPLDSDSDGVYDGPDMCPGTPKGVKVDAKGCPLDSDGDGVYDSQDACPNTPRGVKVDAKGCPPPAPVPAPLFEEGKKTLILEGVNFEYNSAKLTVDAKAILDKTAQALRDNPDVKVEVGGHTDSRGKDLYNLKLSADRARSVLKYLLDKGVDASRLTAKGYGETKPIADNNTDEGRAKNRRVELTKQD